MGEVQALPFKLLPFPGSPAPAIEIAGMAERSGNQLILSYDVTGAIDELLIPSSNPKPDREWGLWEATCFEAFIGVPDRKNYWEVNLSPNGNWNVFALQNYREGLEIEKRVEGLQIQTERSADHFRLITRVPLGAIGLGQSATSLGITTVIQTQESGISYWAIAHCGTEADFHIRESFALAFA